MTSASELFYNRRSRFAVGRSPDPALGLDPRPFPSHSDRGHARRHARRSRGHLHHRGSHAVQERESVWLDETTSNEPGTGNHSSGAISRGEVDRLRLTRNGQLPGAVLQARARLLERLRGISPTESRQTTRVSDVWRDESAVADEVSIRNSGDWEIEILREWIESGTPMTDSTFEPQEALFLGDVQREKPPGLSWEAFCGLQLEVFKNTGEGDRVIRASRDCSICLEGFWEGDELIRLSCGHRFHPACLEPWARMCGDCPYCRASI